MDEQVKNTIRTNELILLEFYNQMKGIINNRYNKSKGWQFSMLNKNLEEAMGLVSSNNDRIRQLSIGNDLDKKQLKNST